MHTIAAAKTWAARHLGGMPPETLALTADLLLGLVLGWDRVRVLSHPEAVLSAKQWACFEDLVRRRARGEPLQYLRGEQEFYGRTFAVGPGVLIPRPETEILVEAALGLIRNAPPGRTRVVDVGTGSGCIAVSIAREIPAALVFGTDISAAALRIARENAARHDAAIRWVRADLLRCFPPGPLFDFIVSNPPYVPLGEYDTLPSTVKDYEPHAALFGGPSGLEVLDRLIPEASSRLAAGGHVLVEVGAGQSGPVAERMQSEGLDVRRVVADLGGIRRCVVAQKHPWRSHGQDPSGGR